VNLVQKGIRSDELIVGQGTIQKRQTTTQRNKCKNKEKVN